MYNYDAFAMGRWVISLIMSRPKSCMYTKDYHCSLGNHGSSNQSINYCMIIETIREVGLGPILKLPDMLIQYASSDCFQAKGSLTMVVFI